MIWVSLNVTTHPNDRGGVNHPAKFPSNKKLSFHKIRSIEKPFSLIKFFKLNSVFINSDIKKHLFIFLDACLSNYFFYLWHYKLMDKDRLVNSYYFWPPFQYFIFPSLYKRICSVCVNPFSQTESFKWTHNLIVYLDNPLRTDWHHFLTLRKSRHNLRVLVMIH